MRCFFSGKLTENEKENVMCTSIAFSKGGFCFGRNMDIEYDFGGQTVIVPRNFPFKFRKAGELSSHYAIVGTAAVAEGYPLFADGMNEHGLCMAGLSFPESVYPDEVPSREWQRTVSPFELIPWVLGKCATLGDARALLKETAIIAIPFSESLPLTPLHWHIADENGSIAVECTADGMRVYDDPAGVLTNSPALPFHLTNMRQYLSLTPAYPESRFGMELSPFGRGFGGIGLPGDLSPASRFVRAAFYLHNSPEEQNELRPISQVFHVLDSVSMPRGSVFTDDGREEITAYSCCMSAESRTYFYKTYDNSTISSVSLFHEDLDGSELYCFPMNDTPSVKRIN